MIHLEEVTKTYPNAAGGVTALDRVSIDVSQGDFVAVTGPSGCGKTTLLLVVAGLATPDSGEVVVAGQNVPRLSGAARARFRALQIGFVFQTFHLLAYLDVRDNVLAAARPGNVDAGRRADELIERFGLTPRARHRPGELSAGERQRAALARALINRPALILADEPTGNLDPHHGRVVLDLLAEYHRGGGTVLLVTHDEEAAARGSRRIRLAAGKIAG